MPEIIIRDNPGLKSLPRKIVEMGFTGFVWALWVYLLLPFVNILIWVFGIKYFHFSVIEQVGYMELMDLFKKMGWIVLIIFLVMRLWGYYNYYRFGRRCRRESAKPASFDQLAAHFNIPSERIKTMQRQKEVVMRFPGRMGSAINGNHMKDTKGPAASL